MCTRELEEAPPAQADAEAAVDEPPSEEVAPLFIDLHSVAT